jgi:hypothetical protein
MNSYALFLSAASSVNYFVARSINALQIAVMEIALFVLFLITTE